MKRFGIFNKPLKRDMKQDQVLSGAKFNSENDDADIVFAGSERADAKPIGNLETYLSQLSANDVSSSVDISTAEVVNIEMVGSENSKTVSEIAAAADDVSEILGTDATEEANEELGVQIDDAYAEDSVEENLSDNAVDFENNGFKNDENLCDASGENSITEAEEFIGIDADFEQFDNFSAENESEDNNKYVMSNVEINSEITSFEEECRKQLETEDNISDDNVVAEEDDENGVASDVVEVVTKTPEENTNEDSVIVFESDEAKNKEDNTSSENLVSEDVHNNLDVEMSMKEKFISLDIIEKKIYVQKLLSEFEELSEYLVEYRAKIDQKISDLVTSIKSLYTQIGTCDLDEARAIVEKIQKYTKHNVALTELKDYIDSIK